ncbi:fatty acyl-AMP ligase [Ectobacillus panaciterrae]|uniref:fatty acyl-AMP ligase n=1 Tax=Ectobacillus panaciterrae TaxID=363872 RepID=UPI000419171B|nr:fatty acyl-AMP ligase [Ectobacillus panaciterrae]
MIDTYTNSSSLVSLLRHKAEELGERTVFTFLDFDKNTQSFLTFAELDRSAKAIASAIQGTAIKGERAILMFHSGLDYIKAFFGCLYAGVIAVPVYPPGQSRHALRLRSIFENSSPSIALTTSDIYFNIKNFINDFPIREHNWIYTDAIDPNLSNSWMNPNVREDYVAFLQYTSGSTGNPKGVMVTHKNILSNEQLIQNAFEITSDSVIVGWLPLYHDMGLIGNVLATIYSGAHCVLMSPLDFLQRPIRWLQTIHEYKATISGGPNFAYDLCVRKIGPELKQSLDLRTWGLAFNGAEPIRFETMDRFSKSFECCGFRRESFYPCYGLAESALFVTGGLKSKDVSVDLLDRRALEQGNALPISNEDDSAVKIVNCGTSGVDHTVKIVNPETGVVCSSNMIGEIWINGASVASGYWNNPEATDSVFQARLSDAGEEFYLRTGDLGYMTESNELFVTGRIKDLIIIRGRNYYPQDIELTVENSHPAIRPGCSAAFTIDTNEQERLIIVAELERRYRPRNQNSSDTQKSDEEQKMLREIVSVIRRAIADEHSLQVYKVLFIKTGSIPKTSSGKIQRSACRIDYLSETLEIWGES